MQPIHPALVAVKTQREVAQRQRAAPLHVRSAKPSRQGGREGKQSRASRLRAGGEATNRQMQASTCRQITIEMAGRSCLPACQSATTSQNQASGNRSRGGRARPSPGATLASLSRAVARPRHAMHAPGRDVHARQ